MDAWDHMPPIAVANPNALKGKKPNKSIPVPSEFRRDMHVRERDMLVDEIKNKTGCTITPQLDHGRIYQFGIFGAGAGLEKAVRHINDWISKAHNRTKDSSAWAKMPAFDAKKWYDNQIGEQVQQHKQIFRGPISEAPEGEEPVNQITVHWPESLTNQGISPRDVFNNKLEALDAIRMQNEVFIVLLPTSGESWNIKIAGKQMVNIDAAEAHLTTMIDKVKVEAMGNHHTLNIVLDDQEGMKVILEEAEAWWPNHHDSVVPRLLPSGMMEIPGSFRGEIMHFTQLSKIQRSFQWALEAARHKKGSYDFAIRLGCLAMSSKQIKADEIGKIYKKEIFQKSIDSSVDLDIKKWLADNEQGYLILGALSSADEFLEPRKSAGYYGFTPRSLKGTRPMYRGTWVFNDPSTAKQAHTENLAPQVGLIVVQVEWTDDEEGLYEKTASRFYKLEAGKPGPIKHMDINLLELGESRGWHFALESLDLVPAKSISPVLTGFADRVKMRPKHEVTSTESFAEWEQTPTIKKNLRTGHLDTIYSFGIKESCYNVELTSMWYLGQKLPVWGLSVRHTEWATHLAELERLPVGSKADWGRTITTFFPDDGQSSYSVAVGDEEFGMNNLSLGHGVEAPPHEGIRFLVDKLLQLSAIVSSVTDTGRGGVTI
ncbi:hypothetical protein BDW02DRAFT_548101 [Decorospora gaudefroyi]|uniref:DUF7905 domain-containing protein n=1 Tax=Decorospora gaudefroyi TaxID=184978 RepID=A0A6A5KE38_9PLEO|nr:hypothetical protein BDW02DRAFT_548101 [Decorospora gaudefroyi]